MSTILIVDDRPSNVMLARALLESAGYRCLEARDGAGGVAAAQREQPDLVLMDVVLPGISGIEATRRLKALAETRNIPVIALTAVGTTGERDAIVAAGCDALVAKPYRVDELLDTVRRVLAAHAGPGPAPPGSPAGEPP